MTIHGIDGRHPIDWRPILTAAHNLARNGGDATALGGALARLLEVIPDEVLLRWLARDRVGQPRSYDQLTEQEGGPPNERIGEPVDCDACTCHPDRPGCVS